MGSHKL